MNQRLVAAVTAISEEFGEDNEYESNPLPQEIL
jgi:hypothetical protein